MSADGAGSFFERLPIPAFEPGAEVRALTDLLKGGVFPHGAGETRRAVINPEWLALENKPHGELLLQPGAFDAVHAGPPPRTRKPKRSRLWNPGSVRPKRPGWYRARVGNGVWAKNRRWWRGKWRRFDPKTGRFIVARAPMEWRGPPSPVLWSTRDCLNVTDWL